MIMRTLMTDRDHFLEGDTDMHCWESLSEIIQHPDCQDILLDIGMPVKHKDVRYNCRLICYNKEILLIRPKLYLANDGNYYEMWASLEFPFSNADLFWVCSCWRFTTGKYEDDGEKGYYCTRFDEPWISQVLIFPLDLSLLLKRVWLTCLTGDISLLGKEPALWRTSTCRDQSPRSWARRKFLLETRLLVLWIRALVSRRVKSYLWVPGP